MSQLCDYIKNQLTKRLPKPFYTQVAVIITVLEDSFPRQIRDPGNNLPDLSIKNPADDIRIENNRNIKPNNPSDALPSASEAFEENRQRSVAFLSVVASIKAGILSIVVAAFLYFFTESDPRHSIALFTIGLYFFDRAWSKYRKFR